MMQSLAPLPKAFTIVEMAGYLRVFAILVKRDGHELRGSLGTTLRRKQFLDRIRDS
jgi:hypothetical protein